MYTGREGVKTHFTKRFVAHPLRGTELKPQKDLGAREGAGWGDGGLPHISTLSLKAVCFSTSASGLGGFQISSEGDRTNEESERGWGWGEREIK